MNGISFALDWKTLPIVLAAALLAYLLLGVKKKWPSPKIYVSSLEGFADTKKSWRSYLADIPQQLQWAALALFLVAFIDPRFYVDIKPDQQTLPKNTNFATEGIAIYLVLDQSGSMTEEVNTIAPDGVPVRMSKINLVKQVTSIFINGDPSLGLSGRPNDLIGLVEFARIAHVVVPLTLDHQEILNKLNDFQHVTQEDQDGTAIGYAVYKTVNLIVATRDYAKDLIGQGKPAYEIKSSVILLVTDGLQDPNTLDNGNRWRQIDPIEAAQFAKENGVRLYIVNVEPALTNEKYAPNRRQMIKAAELTGGKFYIMDNNTNLANIYSEIDQLEKSKLPIQQELIDRLQSQLSKDQLPTLFRRISLYPYLIGLGLLCILLGALLETTVYRRAP